MSKTAQPTIRLSWQQASRRIRALTQMIHSQKVEIKRLKIASGESPPPKPLKSVNVCPRVAARVTCEPCGYPFSEAMGDDDTIPHREAS